MKIADKSEKDFFKWMAENSHYGLFILDKYSIDSEMMYSSYIDWLDSVSIHISIHYETMGSYYFNAMVTNKHLTTNLRLRSATRNEALKEAIEQASEIYNFRTNNELG